MEPSRAEFSIDVWYGYATFHTKIVYGGCAEWYSMKHGAGARARGPFMATCSTAAIHGEDRGSRWKLAMGGWGGGAASWCTRVCGVWMDVCL